MGASALLDWELLEWAVQWTHGGGWRAIRSLAVPLGVPMAGPRRAALWRVHARMLGMPPARLRALAERCRERGFWVC